MADNTPITAGSGTASVASDEISGIQYQRIKITDGRDGGTSSLIVSSDGMAHVSVMGVVNISGSVAATITNTNTNVSGSVATVQTGTVTTSLVGTVPSSIQVGASVMGHAPVVGS